LPQPPSYEQDENVQAEVGTSGSAIGDVEEPARDLPGVVPANPQVSVHDEVEAARKLRNGRHVRPAETGAQRHERTSVGRPGEIARADREKPGEGSGGIR